MLVKLLWRTGSASALLCLGQAFNPSSPGAVPFGEDGDPALPAHRLWDMQHLSWQEEALIHPSTLFSSETL